MIYILSKMRAINLSDAPDLAKKVLTYAKIL
jgi:hypothetical protein